MSKDTISLKPSKKPNSDTPTPARPGGLRSWFPRLLSFTVHSWEIIPILLVAGFLRFYQINTTELDDDQAKLYRMAYDAVHHGLVPTTSNIASIGIAHPPGVIYLFMPIAALSANPLWGAVLVGVFTTAAAVLTYFFARRYYGRFAGVVAALLYTTAAKPLNYARFIWQPNLMTPFVILYQMHPTTLLLAIPLLVAMVLAPGTLRWRDLALAVVLPLVIFFPYLVWEVFTRFADVHTIFTLAKQHAHIDSQALHFYRLFLSPYDQLPTDPHSVVRMLVPVLSWLAIFVPLLTLGGFVTAGLLLLWSKVVSGVSRVGTSSRMTLAGALWSWWKEFRAAPYRCGLLLLLTWQIVPLLILSRHSIALHSQYFFMFLPGPFILIGLLLAKAVEWFQAQGRQWNILRYGTYALATLVIITQLVGSTAA